MTNFISPNISGAFTPQLPDELWVGIFGLLDINSVDKAASVCKVFQEIIKDQKHNNPLTNFVLFYLRNNETAAILNKFHELDNSYQNLIKEKAWVAGGMKKIPYGDWVEEEMQSNIKGSVIYKTIVAGGKLGLNLSDLKKLQKVVEDTTKSSKEITLALKKNPKVERVVKNTLCLMHSEFHYDHQIFTFLENNPHHEDVKAAVINAEKSLVAQFNHPDRHTPSDPKSLHVDQNVEMFVSKDILRDFLSFYNESEDTNAILRKFSNLDPIYQDLIKTMIWVAGGEQIVPLGDWAQEEMQNNMKGGVVSTTMQKIKQVLPTLTKKEASKLLIRNILFLFERTVADVTQSPEPVINALKKLEEFDRIGGHNLAHLIKYHVWELHRLENESEMQSLGMSFSSGPYSYKTAYPDRLRLGFEFIENYPHDEKVIMAITNTYNTY